MKLSERTENLIASGKGYRAEGFLGSGERDLQKVLYYEMNELTNSDSIDFCLNNYKKYLSKKERNTLHQTSMMLCGFDDISKTYAENWEDMCEKSAKIITDLARKILGLNEKAPVYCIWLASDEAVEDIYQIDEEMEIDEYSLEGMSIISDVGYDGVLFISSTCPQPNTP